MNAPDLALRRVVRLVALLNLGYFGVEFAVALAIGSVSLFADSVDFLEDASVNFLILAALASPGLAVAQEAFVAGALTGGLAGGPIGTAIGGIAGAAIGGAAEAEHAHQQSVRPVADLGSVTQAYPPPQRTTEAFPRHTARTYSPPRAVPVQLTRVQRQQLASAVAAMERTCVRDRAGNQTCREVIQR